MHWCHLCINSRVWQADRMYNRPLFVFVTITSLIKRWNNNLIEIIHVSCWSHQCIQWTKMPIQNTFSKYTRLKLLSHFPLYAIVFVFYIHTHAHTHEKCIEFYSNRLHQHWLKFSIRFALHESESIAMCEYLRSWPHDIT